MYLIPVLILAAGLNGAVSSPLPASHVQHAQARLNRMVAVASPVVRQRGVTRAVATGTHRLGTDIAHELTLTRVKTAAGLTPPQSRPSRLTPEFESRLDTRHLAPLRKPGSVVQEFESGASSSSVQAAPATPQPKQSATLAGGLLIGFLALASLVATAFWRGTR
ncbi:MAG: hypothetical protein ACRESR_00195 [Gammaproteobacteria bacterium]